MKKTSVMAVWMLTGGSAWAAETAAAPVPTLLEADRLVYDQEHQIYTAESNAEAAHGHDRLRADRLTYDASADRVTAEGHTVMTRDEGIRVTADRAELSRDFDHGVLHQAVGTVGKTTRVAADTLTYDRDRANVFDNVVYSPCKICETLGAPLWQVRSIKITDDATTQTVSHEQPTFDIFGLPVASVPYLEHPSPGVRRRSGLLIPSITSDRNNGQGVRIPYFFDPAPDRDLTLTPTIYTGVLPLIDAEYRQRFDHLAVTGTGYLTQSDVVYHPGQASEQATRGALAVRGLGEDGDARYAFDVMRATDDTFLRRYRITDARTLNSRFIYAVPGEDGNAFRFATEAEQSMSANDNDRRIPIVMPFITARQKLGTDPLGFTMSAEESFLALNRLEGRDTVRVSSEINGTKRLPDLAGFRLTAFDSLRTDLYRFTPGVNTGNSTDGLNGGTVGRALPAVGLNAALPVYGRHDYGIRDLWEPQVEAILAPYGGNNGRIPNEDGTSSALENYAPFGLQRLYGKDRVETGPRINAGFRHAIAQPDVGQLAWSAVQTFRLKEETALQSYGLGDTRSDYVVRGTYNTPFGLSLSQTLRADKDTLAQRSTFTNGAYTVGDYSFNASYLATRANIDPLYPTERKDLSYGASYKWNDHWSFNGGLSNNLAIKTTPGQRVGAIYTDECLRANLFIANNATTDRDVASGTTIGLQIELIPLAADAIPLIKAAQDDFNAF